MKPARLLSLTGFAVLMAASVFIWKAELLVRFDQQYLDTLFDFNRRHFPQPVANDVVVVGINDEFIDSIDEPSALSHFYLGEFLRAVSEVKPKVIALDVALPEKRFDTLMSSRNPDTDYHRALLMGLLQATQNTTVVVAKVWDGRHNRYQNINVDYAAVLASQDTGVQPSASALFKPDGDGQIRRYPGPEVQPDKTDRTFTSEIAAAASGVRKPWGGFINYQIGRQFTFIPIQDVLTWAREGKQAELASRFAGKPVLLGTVLADEDRLSLPVQLVAGEEGERMVFGVFAQAQMVRSMLNQGFIMPLAAGWLLLLCLLFGLLWFGERLRLKIALFAAASAALLAASEWLLLQGLWLPPAAILATGMLAVLASSGLQAWHTFRDKQTLMRTFSGSVSPQVMKEIIAGGLGADRQGSKLPVCVMFSDIRGFTTMSEKLPAEEVVTLLNRYFARMTAAVHRHGGTVDKFIGDGMMAFFGAPNRIDNPEQCALAAARDMLAALKELNAEFVAEGRTTVSIGIGLNSGEVVIGYIGSPERHEYTAIGDTVNIAARLEGLCKDVGAPIVCSRSVAQAAGFPPQLVDCGERALKGRSSMIVYGWQEDSERISGAQPTKEQDALPLAAAG